jgi:cytochrome bd-type quinol oxidase subunit 2
VPIGVYLCVCVEICVCTYMYLPSREHARTHARSKASKQAVFVVCANMLVCSVYTQIIYPSPEKGKGDEKLCMMKKRTKVSIHPFLAVLSYPIMFMFVCTVCTVCTICKRLNVDMDVDVDGFVYADAAVMWR